MSAATKVEHAALLRAAMQTGGAVASGVTHDLNSALQILGDSLYAIRDDTQTLIQEDKGASSEARASVDASLKLADDALARLSGIAKVVSNLATSPPDDGAQVLVE